MSTLFRAAALLLLFVREAGAAVLTGRVHDAGGQPVAGAAIEVIGLRSVVSDAGGGFTAEVPDGSYDVRVTHTGFRAQTLRITAGAESDVTLQPAMEETIT